VCETILAIAEPRRWIVGPKEIAFDALARIDRDYLLARAVQFFAPGVPQVYYVGLLAGHNETAPALGCRPGHQPALPARRD
jgi:hypothetical protein